MRDPHTRTALTLSCSALLILAAGCVDPAPVAQDISQAAARTWTWIEIDGMACADGTPTGVGVNVAPGARGLVIYLEGGGACWDEQSCYEDELASFISEPFEHANFSSLVEELPERELFRRDDATNPARDWTHVYVPYCTGDVHGGSVTAEYGGRRTMHVGHINMARVLEHLAASSPQVERVILTGSSAGGYGAALNYAQVAQTFSEARVDMINDGGPLIPLPQAPRERISSWIRAWGLTSIAPAGCERCDTELTPYMAANFEAYPQARFALLSYTRDGVIAEYHGVDGATLERGLEALRADAFEGAPNARVFYKSGEEHTMYTRMRQAQVRDTNAWEWIQVMLSDDPAWEDVTP